MADPNPPERAVWRSYTKHLRGHRWRLALGVAAAMVQTAVLLPVPLLVREAIDTAIPEERMALLLALGAGMLAAVVLSGSAAIVNKKLALSAVTPATRDLRMEALEKLYDVSREFHTRSVRSQLHDQLVQQTVRIDRMAVALLSEALAAVLLSASIIVILALINWQLALVLVALGPMMYIANLLLGRRVKKASRSYHKALERFSRGVLFVLGAMDLTRIQAAETAELRKQRARVETLGDKAARHKWLVTVYQATQRTVVAGAGVWVLIAGGALAVRGTITIGELLSFYAAVALLQGPLTQLTARIPVIIEGRESLHSLYELLATTDRRPYVGTTSIDFQGNVVLKDVTFGYRAGHVLEDVSLTMSPGRVLALIGLNGAGKTTLTNLIHGFYRPQAGTLFADGVPYDEVDMAVLRSRIGVVQQQPIVFSGTVRENVAYGFDDVAQGRLDDAMAIAEATELVNSLPGGYEYEVGEDGAHLSGGQRQRLAIARAVLGDPSLLVLDEPTNHLDEVSMIRILRNLLNMEHRPAILLVSHHAQVVALADQTFLVENHRLTEVDGSSTLHDWAMGPPAVEEVS